MTTQSRYMIEGDRCDDGSEWLVIDTRSLVPPDRSIASCRSESDARLIADALNAFSQPRFISQAPMAKAIQ
jgi:hypothetical protein